MFVIIAESPPSVNVGGFFVSPLIKRPTKQTINKDMTNKDIANKTRPMLIETKIGCQALNLSRENRILKDFLFLALSSNIKAEIIRNKAVKVMEELEGCDIY